MPSRNELVIRANAVGIDPTTIPNDSKLEQKILFLEKNATTFSGTLATQTLTSDATNPSNGETVTIGNRTYTFRTALTGVKATQTLTSDATAPSDGDTVTIFGKTYTYKTTLSNPVQQNEVLIGASAAIALDNLKLAINGGSTAYPTAADASGMGSTWSTGTVRHDYVTATTNTNTTQVVEARNFGTEANSYDVAETSSHLSWGATTLSGGTANVVDEILIGADAATTLDYLKDAINNTAVVGTEGTHYSYGTKAHTQVTATTNTNTTQVVQAIDYSYTNASIATTETSTHLSWGAATLASGVAKVVAANTTTTSGSAGISGDKNHN